MNCRDFFGTLLPFKGDGRDTRCAFWSCQQAGTHQRASQSTDRRFCAKHAAMWDAGLLTGSIAAGYKERA